MAELGPVNTIRADGVASENWARRGGVLLLAARLGLPLGRLPGDISYRGKNIAIYFPLGTSIVVSIVLSLIFFIFSRLHR